MYTFLLPLLMGAPEAAGAEGGGNLFMSFLPFIAIILIFYLLIIRPQNKKRKETEKMLSALKKGDKVVSIGGIYGTIHTVKDTTVIVKVDDNVKLEFLRSAISSIITVAPVKEEKISEPEKEKDETTESGE
jgi:preprotein translocase subunit YajC